MSIATQFPRNTANESIETASTFTKAIKLLIDAYKFEQGQFGDEDGRWQRAIEEAKRAQAIYLKHLWESMGAAIDEMRDGEWQTPFADALESGDCSLLQF